MSRLGEGLYNAEAALDNPRDGRPELLYWQQCPEQHPLASRTPTGGTGAIKTSSRGSCGVFRRAWSGKDMRGGIGT